MHADSPLSAEVLTYDNSYYICSNMNTNVRARSDLFQYCVFLILFFFSLVFVIFVDLGAINLLDNLFLLIMYI